MSWDVYLHDEDGAVLELPQPLSVLGGTYAIALAGVEAWLNITYNYGAVLRRVLPLPLGDALNGRRADETIPMLVEAISQLGDEPPAADYWAPTDSNARVALEGLLEMARALPHGHWSVT